MALRGLEKRGWAIQPSQLLWKLSDKARQFRQSRLLTKDAALGRRGEDIAHRYLYDCGYKVVARNYRAGPDSEVDIVALQGDVVVFVEVKSRSTAEFGAPDRAIDLEKQRHIMRAARGYATRANIEWNRVRFDVISIVFADPLAITHQQDVFFHGRAN